MITAQAQHRPRTTTGPEKKAGPSSNILVTEGSGQKALEREKPRLRH
jgi:hypothetical protein